MDRESLKEAVARKPLKGAIAGDLLKRAAGSGSISRTAISLFSGGGGLDIGIEAAGFRTLACIEKDANACETLKRNQGRYFTEANIINASVTDVNVQALMKELGLRKGQLDLLFGGPPCQTFSQIGKKTASETSVEGCCLRWLTTREP